jgi:glycosyltransferase involved in cell wall biosynthesis
LGASVTTVLDLAGGTGGGAGRFREQYLRYATERALPARAALGLEEHVTPGWLIRRESLAQGSTKAVAANNVGFVRAGTRRWTLLRNANHFLSPDEWEATKSQLGLGFAAQTRMVHLAAHRSEALVVPSTSMAERVAARLPRLADRLIVRFHPLQVPPRVRAENERPAAILCPIVNSPYKKLTAHLELLQRALGNRAVRVTCTMTRGEASASLRSDARFTFVGVLDRAALRREYDAAGGVYYPTSVESFGYPLAEARAEGMPVIAQDTAHNREIADGALFGYRDGDSGSLADAVDGALSTDITADPKPFAPTPYFDWLISS